MEFTAIVVALVGLANLANGFASPLVNPVLGASSSILVPPTGVDLNISHAPNVSIKSTHQFGRRDTWDASPMATDEQWCKAQAKGAQMYMTFFKSDIAAGAMYKPPRQTANSFFTKGNIFNQLFNVWGWHNATQRYNDAKYDSYYGQGWLNAMKYLAIGIEPWKDVWNYHYGHGVKDLRDEKGQPIPVKEQVYTAFGHEHPATGARAKFGVQDKAGAIMVSVAVSPTIAYKELHGQSIHIDDLPQLRSLSDLLWAGWLSGSNPNTGNPNPNNLKYIFMMWIVNKETLGIMKRALGNKGKDKYSVWPGDDFPVSGADGQALLGSPNGKPVGYLVNQHKQELGYQ